MSKKKIKRKKKFFVFAKIQRRISIKQLKRMKFYITCHQHAALVALINLQAAEYESKHRGEIHKYTAHAFIDNTILICFENHKPKTFSYLTTNLGTICDQRQSETDVELKLNDHGFDLFASRVPCFTLSLSQPSHDGVCFSQTAKVVMDFSWCDEYDQ
jgi:hypothetical protein